MQTPTPALRNRLAITLDSVGLVTRALLASGHRVVAEDQGRREWTYLTSASRQEVLDLLDAVRAGWCQVSALKPWEV